MVAGAERIRLRNFSAKVGDLLQASGDVDLALGATPSGKGDVRVQGSNLRQLAELLGGAAQPSLPARPFLLRGQLAGENTISLQNMTFELDALATLKGNASVTPRPSGMPDLAADMRLTVPSLRPLAAALGQGHTLPTQPVNGTFKVSSKAGVLSLDTVTLALDALATLNATGTVDMTQAKPSMDIQVAVKGDDMAATARAFEVAGAVPVSPFSAQARVAGAGTLTLSGANVDLPGLLQARMDGTVMTGSPANIDGAVVVDLFQADRLGYCAAAPKGAATSAAGAGAGAASSAAPWSDEVLNLDGLRRIALNLTVTVKSLVCGSFPAENLKVVVRNTPSQLDMKDLNVGLRGGGSIGGALTLAHAGTPKLSTDLTFRDLKVEDTVPALQAKGMKLPLNGRINLNSVGATSRALAQNLGGTLDLNADQGVLPYTDMLGNVVALERILQGQAALPANGNGAVDKLQGAVVVRQGIATVETLTISTGNGAMTLTGTGQVDLPNWTVDVTLTPKIATSSGLEVPVLVRGPLTAPSIAADPAFVSKLTGRLATQGLKGLLGKDNAQGVGGVLGDVFSGKGVTQEGVGNLINQFVKPKTPAAPASPTANPTAPATAPTTPDAAAPAEAAPAPETQAPTPEDVLKNALPGLINGVLGQ